jgi:uncharacterized membrane protein YkvA (DUF1232 family)
MNELEPFQSDYSDPAFRSKLGRVARSAGRAVVEKALLLYYTLQEDRAPAWAKAIIVGALGYFVAPLDAIPDLTPALGYSDDLGMLVLAIVAVSTYVNDDVKARAEARLQQWFGPA